MRLRLFTVCFICLSSNLLAAQLNLLGNYGFLSDFTPRSEQSARDRIAFMVTVFGIKEFQFYDWFAGYSTPISGDSWKDPYFKSRECSKQVIEIFIDEIHRHGGRAWAYVQAQASESDDLENENPGVWRARRSNGEKYNHEGKLHVYLLSRQLAARQVETWGLAVKELGFDGIHWDTLGSFMENKVKEREGNFEFIEEASKKLSNLGLQQTANFLDLAWWDANRAGLFVSFPYAELWTQSTEDFIAMMGAANRKGVLVRYRAHMDEAKLAHAHGHSLLLVGDGNCRLQSEYFPSCVCLSDEEVKEVATLRL